MLDDRYESYPGVIHGGIVTTVADEVMGHHVALNGQAIYLTSVQKTRFLSPIKSYTEYACSSSIVDSHDIPAGVLTKLSADITRTADGEVVAMSDATYRKIAFEDAAEKIGVFTPTADAFQSDTSTTNYDGAVSKRWQK